jgi:D-galactarolactone isomerase
MATTDSKPQLKAPPGACDTHMHFYNARYPTAPTAKITPPDVSVADYRKVQARLGLERVVVVQPTTYGADNRRTLDSIAEIGPSARGVAVVDQNVTDAELEQLTKAGIRGVRFHMLPGGALEWDVLDAVAARVVPFGWHLQLQLDGGLFPEREAAIKRFPGTLVIDHIGKFLQMVTPEHAAFRVLARLVEGGKTYVKLSAPYEFSKSGPPEFADAGTLAKALIAIAPDRMLWATNWPHPGEPAGHKPDEAMLLDTLMHWTDDDATRRKILADNPARLYGF